MLFETARLVRNWGNRPPVICSEQQRGTRDLKKVRVIYRDKEWEMRGGLSVRDVVAAVGLDPQAVLAVRNGKLITEDTSLKEDDTVTLVAVVSGG
jgi:sulfur carrier protein ThiS